MSDTRTKQSARNMFMGFAYQALMMLLSFVSRTIFIYTLGTEYLGLNSIFSDVLTLLSMADLGFSTAMAYSFYKPLVENDHAKIRALIHLYKKIYNIIAVAVLVLGLACIPFLKVIVNTDKDIPNLVIYYLFALLNVVLSYLFVYKTTLLNADQKNYKILSINMWCSLIKVILQIAALLITKNYILYLAIGLVMQFVNNYLASLKAEKEYPYLKDKSEIDIIDKKIQSNIFSNMKSVFIYKISGTMFSATDNIIISMVINTAAVGLYSNYFMISNKLMLIENIVFSALTASVGNVVAKESAAKRFQIFKALQSASFIFSGIICSLFCIMVNDLVRVWLGEMYVLSDMMVIAVTLNTYLACVLVPLWTYRDATGIYMKTKYVMLAGAILNIVLSFVLGKVIGLPGIIFASAIARISTYFWYEPKLLFKEFFESSVLKYYISIFENILLVVGTIVVITFFSKGFIVNSWFSLIIKGVIIGIICCIVYLIAYSRTEGFQIILSKVKGICKRK